MLTEWRQVLKKERNGPCRSAGHQMRQLVPEVSPETSGGSTLHFPGRHSGRHHVWAFPEGRAAYIAEESRAQEWTTEAWLWLEGPQDYIVQSVWSVLPHMWSCRNGHLPLLPPVCGGRNQSMGSILEVPREEWTNKFLGQYAKQGFRVQAHKPRVSYFVSC